MKERSLSLERAMRFDRYFKNAKKLTKEREERHLLPGAPAPERSGSSSSELAYFRSLRLVCNGYLSYNAGCSSVSKDSIILYMFMKSTRENSLY